MSAALPDFIAGLDPDRVVLVAGPTASGKSDLALRIALAQGRSVINADALQVYDGWRILTARPAPEEMQGVPHLLYGTVDYRTAFTTGDWLRAVAPLLQMSPAPVIAGGTGLYFQALTAGLADIPPTLPEVRAAANARLAGAGLERMVEELDAGTRSRIDLRNPARVQRAWEVLTQTGRGLAEWQAETGTPLLRPEDTLALKVVLPVERLNARIDQRFDRMMEIGAREEARRMAADWDPSRLSSRAIGAAELIAALRGEMTESEAVAAAKLATRQYAKRQRTWIRNKMSGWTQFVSEP